MSVIKLIVGLGNPGPDYLETRHNAGAWFVEHLARRGGTSLVAEKKFFGEHAQISLHNSNVRLLFPSTFMNESGKSVAAVCNFYKIVPEEVLVAHDELDLPVGTIRLKQGGGHGGHNGLRDIISCLGNNKDFLRLRVGIDHPGSAKKVHGYVLKRPTSDDRSIIDKCLDDAEHALRWVQQGDLQKAQTELHSIKPASDTKA